MKTKKLLKILVFNCLWSAAPFAGAAQDALFRVFAAEIAAERPSISCFMPSQIGVHIRNDFCTKEMMFAEMTGQLTVRKNVLTASVNHYGYANYGDFRLSVGYGRNFGNRFAMSARIFYLLAHARGYPARHSLCADFSFAYRLSPKLLFDAAIYNPFMLRYGVVGQEVIPMNFVIGCSYAPIRKLLTSLSVSKSLPGAWEVDCRFLTQPIEPLLLAAECSNLRVGVYIGWRHKRLLFSVRAAWYYRVSVSPEIGGWYFNEMRNDDH
jgi:hypothetical protein